jgi:hypothetical protein
MLKPGDTLHATLARVGYRAEPKCECMKAVSWMNQLGWRMVLQRNAMLRLRAVLFGEARRRGIIPAGTPIGWWPLIRYGIRDRITAAWRSIRNASTR